jgi:hypothetical protein
LFVAGGRPALALLGEIAKLDKAGHELASVLMGQAGRVGFLFPDNSFRTLSVDSAIAKGMSNILDERQSPLVQHMFPEREYVIGRYPPEHYRRNPVDVSAFSALVFVVPLTIGRNKPEQMEALEDYFSVSLALFDCTRDVDFSAVRSDAQIVVVCLRHDGVLGREDTGRGRVFYVPTGANVRPGAPVRAGSGLPTRLREGDLVLSGHSGQLMRIERDGRAVRLTTDEHHRIEVPNVGQWDNKTGGYRGLTAEYVQGRWVIDGTSVQPANTNSRFEQGDEHDPIPGFRISPEGAHHRITLLRDKDGAFIRVEATRTGPYLVVNGAGVPTLLAGTPVTVRGTIRAHGSGKIALIWHEAVGSGLPESLIVQTDADDAWQTLVNRRAQVTHPAPGDNFGVGLIDPRKGDWFDVRELGLFVGTLP